MRSLFVLYTARVPLLPMPVFTPHQDAALTAAANWLKGARGRASIFRLFGYAGTGKTTLAKHLAEGIDGNVLFAAFTGKAACVMRSKGCNGATTIHSLIYKARDNGEETPSFELWHEAPASKAKLIVVDECSMVDAELAHDLMSFQVPLPRASRLCRSIAHDRRQASLPAQQPSQGLVQRRALDGERAPAQPAANHPNATHARR